MRNKRARALKAEARRMKASNFFGPRISQRQIYRRLKKKHNRGY